MGEGIMERFEESGLDVSSVTTLPVGARCRARGAVVLGATLALGGCGLTGCNDGADAAVPSLASSRVAEHAEAPSATEEVVVEEEEEPEAEPEPELPRLGAEEGRVGTVEANPGFVPDPLTKSGTTAGGPVDAHVFDDRCEGWIAAQPDLVLNAGRPFAELAVMVGSEEDTTLMVVGPQGDPLCADDDDGSNPVLKGPFRSGVYRVWVGTRRREAEAPFVLALSELDDSSPSDLLHCRSDCPHRGMLPARLRSGRLPLDGGGACR